MRQMNDRIRGMKDALHLIEGCEMHDTGTLNAAQSAACMKEIILGCVRAHIRASERTVLDEDIET